ncbi:MAG TPA: putative glycolipid-binding domain-containing protein [Solirubrobacterales bacterium]|nr:putative glycolipid-binding domain-containing protein [Solirubrobacterales bacterium]
MAIWKGVDGWRAEAATIELQDDSLSARGTQIGVEQAPYRVDYELVCGPGFTTRELRVEARGDGWRRSLVLGPDELAGALDCDLGFSPLTNLMPVLRHGLHRGSGEHEITVAWVAVPELSVHRARQRYTHLGPGRVRFESLDGEFAGFTAELELDGDGLIRLYPGLARRL